MYSPYLTSTELEYSLPPELSSLEHQFRLYKLASPQKPSKPAQASYLQALKPCPARYCQLELGYIHTPGLPAHHSLALMLSSSVPSPPLGDAPQLHINHIKHPKYPDSHPILPPIYREVNRNIFCKKVRIILCTKVTLIYTIFINKLDL